MPRWSVDIIRNRTQHLGTVEASNEKEALAKAIKHFEIERARQNRITVTKISDRTNNTPRLLRANRKPAGQSGPLSGREVSLTSASESKPVSESRRPHQRPIQHLRIIGGRRFK